MTPFTQSRRAFFETAGIGLGSLAFNSLLGADAAGNTSSQPFLQQPHFPPTVKSVIFLFMSGGPGHMDTFDPKPVLSKMDGEYVPGSIAATVPNIPRAGVGSKLMASPFGFKKYGESGIEVSDLLPHTARHVDDLCVIRSLNHRIPVHGPGENFTLTGSSLGERPSLGGWVTYGLGSEAQDLPGFIVLSSNSSGPAPQRPGWGSGFLPARFQGTQLDNQRGVPYSELPDLYSVSDRRNQLDFIRSMNQQHLRRQDENTELEARIESYELGFRMQLNAPEILDLSGETEATQRMYGIDQKASSLFGSHCLLARRLVEQGVRFIQLRNGGWDAHGSLKGNHINRCRATDMPVAGLLQDLKQRNLLDQTLVIWGGEFGRTPTTEGSRTGDARGRDHSPAGYTMWMAGGGIKGGQVIGATDELGYVPIDRPLSPHDLHATMLHGLGLDQHKLIYLHNNREEIPTVLGGEVIREAFAT
ncbi:hypothetical protein Poly24_03930 [Rosistilla carotiformis]|uniref:Sulfatase n=1 Tax=Rosistilla carotiformis TaxID=2528017 RepID=A0A518JMC4_9BACT|nr:DUF1501 domain-containing protein [Rosistilla carotiformis]QDV66706.1 hypothetical protein Poly24_03930 [Rosistilla carotiformis]